jgi:flavin reductase (DIM6/NTAB) family NADH-FMN oxidoreductase RutF
MGDGAAKESGMSYFDIDALDAKLVYKLLASVVVPRPIAWTISKDAAGGINCAPFSFFNFFSGMPPVIGIGMGDRAGRPKDTLGNIRATRDFVVNLVTTSLIDAMNTTAVPFPPGVDELGRAGLKTAPCTKVDLPRLADSPVALECRLRQVVDVDATNHIVLAEVLAVHVTDEAVTNAERCYIDGNALHLVGRMQSPGWYTKTDDRFLLKQLSLEQWIAAQESAAD